MRITLTDDEKRFLVNNRRILGNIFGKELEIVKLNVFGEAISAEDRAIEIRFGRWLKEWMHHLDTLGEQPTGASESSFI